MDGRYASIVEDYSASDTDGAWILWSGSLVLARCVEAHAVAAASSAAGVDGSVAAASSLVAVELGAGSGLVSVAAGGVGLAAVATEQDSGLPYLTANTDANRALFADSSGSCQVRRLHWGCAEDMRAVASVVRLAQGDSGTGREAPALLLGSDLTYLPAVMEPLASTLAQLAGPSTIAWIAHDDASHPGCPKHRETFFGTPRAQSQRARNAKRPLELGSEPEPEPEPEAAELEPGAAPWQGTHVGGIVDAHGFSVQVVPVERLIAEEWRCASPHSF